MITNIMAGFSSPCRYRVETLKLASIVRNEIMTLNAYRWVIIYLFEFGNVAGERSEFCLFIGR